MTSVFLVGLGSLIGGMLRYGLNGWVYRALGVSSFPYGTLAVNVLGSFAIGFLAGSAATWMTLGAETRLFLLTGILGGFTTFSAFAFETFALARDGHSGAAMMNITLQLVLGLAAVWLGHLAGHAIARSGA